MMNYVKIKKHDEEIWGENYTESIMGKECVSEAINYQAPDVFASEFLGFV